MTTLPPMNADNRGFDDGEWQVRERARKSVRDSVGSLGEDGTDAAYRAIAQALREPPSIDLPWDFAARVAKLVPPPVPPLHARKDPELRIASALVGVVVASGVALGFRYAGTLGAFLASPLGAWSFSALCCAAAAQGFQFLTTRMARGLETSLR